MRRFIVCCFLSLGLLCNGDEVVFGFKDLSRRQIVELEPTIVNMIKARDAQIIELNQKLMDCQKKYEVARRTVYVLIPTCAILTGVILWTTKRD